MSNTIPDGWSIHRQGDVTDFSNGRAFKLDEWEKEGTPVIRLQNLTGTGKEFYYSNLKLPERQYCKSGDLLYMWSATFGPYIWKGPKAIYHYHIWKVTPNELDLTKSYAFQLLGYKTDEWLNKSNGMGILHVTKGNMEELPLTLPTLPEQKKIAAVLSSVDEVIEKTRAQIDKLKDLKTGMMQELLTKGVGSGGVSHTEFKDSPVGPVPARWKVVEVGEIATQVKPGPFGSSLTKAMYVEKGYKVYGQEQVISSNFKVGNYFIDESKYDELSSFKVAAGDILISLVGTFGQVAVVPETFEAGIINPRLLIIRFPPKNLDPEFSAQQLRSEFVLNQLNQLQQGGTMGVLSATTVKPVKMVIPTLEEQKIIGNSVYSVDKSISAKMKKLQTAQNLKKALIPPYSRGR